MEIIDDNGLRIALISTNEALAHNWAADPPNADVVRVSSPPPEDYSALEQIGFSITPSVITWLADTGTCQEEFVARLADRERNLIRRSQRDLADRGITIKLRAPIDDATLDEFLILYEDQIASMRYGVPYASKMRERILAERESFFAVRAVDTAGALVGGCICRNRPGEKIVRASFVAQTAAERQRGRLVRAMYMAVAQEARERRQPLISLGSDPSLYGHIAKPGLFRLKSRLGFTPVPMVLLGSEAPPDQADLVVRLDALTDPTLVIAYQTPAITISPEPGKIPRVSLRMEVYSQSDAVDTAPYEASFLNETRIHAIDSRLAA